MPHKFSWSKLIQIILVLFIVFGFLHVWHNHDITKQNTANSQAHIREAKVLNNEQKHYTFAKVKNHYDDTQPNLNNAENNATKRLNKGFALAYSSTSRNKLNRNQKQIHNLLGSSITSGVNSEVQPHLAMNMKQYHIAYGEYNPHTKVIPVRIILHYQTQKYMLHRNGLNNQKPKIHEIYTGFEINFYPQNSYNSQFTLTHTDSHLDKLIK